MDKGEFSAIYSVVYCGPVAGTMKVYCRIRINN